MRAIHRAAVALVLCSSGLAWPGLARAQAPTKNIYSFPPGSVGYDLSPSSDLAADRAGNLYGVTFIGGVGVAPSCFNAAEEHCGTIYRLVPPAAKGQPWTEQTLHAFAQNDGFAGTGKPLLDAAGNLYGTTDGGGIIGHQPGAGTIWELRPPSVAGNSWRFTVLYTFPGGFNGQGPTAGLVIDRSGTLYGTAENGGTFGLGVVFSLTPPSAGSTAWTETVLHSFGAPNEFGMPFLDPLLLSADQQTLTGEIGVLVFRFRRKDSGWTYAVLHRFSTQAGGIGVVGGLVSDRSDNLYGATCCGGASGHGVVFKLSPPAPGQTAWTEQVLHSFTGADGDNSEAGLTIGGQAPTLFGTTIFGGGGGSAAHRSHGEGVVFRLDPPASGSGPWTYTVMHAFAAGPRSIGGAGFIQNGLTFGPNRFLFGVATYGGLYDQGAVFAQTPHLP